jgi:hypothetical protein
MVVLKSIQATRLQWLKNYFEGINSVRHERAKIVYCVYQHSGYLSLEISKDLPVIKT